MLPFAPRPTGEPMFITLLASLQSAGACTGHVDAKVVGFDPKGSLALLRLETDREDDRPNAVDIVVFDLNEQTESKRFVILRAEDAGDAATRAKNWKIAEAEAKALGVEVMPDLTSLKVELGGAPSGAVEIPSTGKSLQFSQALLKHEKGPDHDERLTAAHVMQGGRILGTHVISRRMWMSSANAQQVVEGIYAAPGGKRVLLQLGRSCVEPTWYVIDL